MEQCKQFGNQIWRLIKRDWPIFVIMGLLFLAGIWLGDDIKRINPQLAQSLSKRSLDKFLTMAKWLKDLPFFIWILVIFFNNLIAVIVIFISGVLIISPAFMILMNGVVVSFAQKYTAARGLDRTSFYLSLAPHGIFELTAVFIAAGLGIRFGLVLLRTLFGWFRGQENNGLLKGFMTETKYYSILIILLLSVAAVVEVTVSPLLLPK